MGGGAQGKSRQFCAEGKHLEETHHLEISEALFGLDTWLTCGITVARSKKRGKSREDVMRM